MTSINYAKSCADTMMRKFAAPDLPPVGVFHYHAGVFLSGMEQLYLLTGDENYNEYIKAYIDTYIDADGEIHGVSEKSMDDIEPCNLLFRYLENGETRYRKVLDSLLDILKHWDCNSQGGFWHKGNRPNQMWLDGLYMSSPLMTRYALLTGDRDFFDIVHTQLMLMWNNMRDERTGLLYHAWDETKEADWAHTPTGCSSEFWGRAIGWYAVASTDIYDMLPDDCGYRADFARCATELTKALIKFQDKENGLWYQVVDKGNDPDNWTETSCSCLFTYAISKQIRLGLIDKSFAAYADKAFEGITSLKIKMTGNDLIINDICIGTGVCDYDGYLARPRTENDLHGTGAFLLMCTEYTRLKKYLKGELK